MISVLITTTWKNNKKNLHEFHIPMAYGESWADTDNDFDISGTRLKQNPTFSNLNKPDHVDAKAQNHNEVKVEVWSVLQQCWYSVHLHSCKSGIANVHVMVSVHAIAVFYSQAFTSLGSLFTLQL